MEIRKIDIRQINPAPYNPRKDLKPGDPEYEKLKISIETYGYIDPLVWNKQTKNLIGGHQRFKILVEQGLKEIDVSVVDLPLDKEKVLNIALNKIQGSWDEDKLALLLQELTTLPNFDVSLSGFEPPEISSILDNLTNNKEDNFDFDSVVNSIEKPITQPGDLIQLGNHTILCGDSSNPEDLKTLMGINTAQLIYTDPPYNVNYYGGDRPKSNSRPSKHKLWKRIYSDNMTQEKYEKWLKNIFSNMTSYSADGASFYIWNGHKQFGPMYLILKELGYHISCIITWAKEHFTLGYGDYNQQTEFCLYGWKENASPHTWYGPNNETTLWQINRDITRSYIHPTQKPIALSQRAIKNSSKRGDIVLDLFLGSGSTLISAESLGRRCFGIEIDCAYVDGIVLRYTAFVGKNKVPDELRTKYLQEANHGKY